MNDLYDAPFGTTDHDPIFGGEDHDKNERKGWGVIALCSAMMAIGLLSAI